jgi:hypothetical protein
MAMQPGLWEFNSVRTGRALFVHSLDDEQVTRVCIQGSALAEIHGLAAKNGCRMAVRTAERNRAVIDGACRVAGLTVPITVSLTEQGPRRVEVRLVARKNPWVRFSDRTVGRRLAGCPSPAVRVADASTKPGVKTPGPLN